VQIELLQTKAKKGGSEGRRKQLRRVLLNLRGGEDFALSCEHVVNDEKLSNEKLKFAKEKVSMRLLQLESRVN
jgi:hypothetical protein